MIKFTQKGFSIKEGHYTGPKDEERIPSTLSLMAKGAGAGTLAGAVVGAVIKEIDKDGDFGTFQGAFEGAKYGTLSGIAMKFLLNYLHKPMKSVKYQDIDRNIRRTFGVYRVSGITVGDTVDKRASIEEKFGFNDRKVTDYKITFAISDNKIAMYTFGMSDKELDQTDRILDYYCKKYFGMEYSSTPISAKNNSYAVYITFTNCQIVSNFIMELSNTLETKINLLDNNALAIMRISDAAEEEIEESGEGNSRNFSLAGIDKTERAEIFANAGIQFLSKLKIGFGQAISSAAISLLQSSAKELTDYELSKSKFPVPKYKLDNAYLKSVIKKLHYTKGVHYVVKEKNKTVNISLVRGIFLITVPKGSDECKKIDKEFWQRLMSKVRRSEINGKVVSYNYSIISKSDFENTLKTLMSTGIVFNIFE